MIKYILIGLGIIIFLGVALLTLPWLAMFIGIHLMPNPPLPEITHGEFPFQLEYEINGERKVIQDILICDYDGVGADEGQGKYRKWKETLGSGNKRITLLKISDSKEIYYEPGHAKYYMGDMREGEGYKHNFPNASMITKDGKFTEDATVHEEELLEKYNIELIKWDYTQPIKNTFVTKE